MHVEVEVASFLPLMYNVRCIQKYQLTTVGIGLVNTFSLILPLDLSTTISIGLPQLIPKGCIMQMCGQDHPTLTGFFLYSIFLACEYQPLKLD